MPPLGKEVVALQKPLHTAGNSLTRIDNLDITTSDNALNMRHKEWIMRATQDYAVDTLVKLGIKQRAKASDLRR